MRKTLVAAVALAPLCLAASRGVALATDTVTSGLNAPIATATATNGAPDDIDITSGGVSVSGTTPAVTLNSSNSVTNAGSISISGVNNSVAVQAITGTTPLTGSIINSGTISNSESYSPSTANGLNEAPFASPGSQNRLGIQLTGGAPLIGDIINTGTLTVQGNTSSSVISIQAPLASNLATGGTATGSIINSGTVSFVGNNGAAIQSTTAGTIAGNVQLLGAVSAQGQGSSAVSLNGNVGGTVSVYAAVTSTGYAETSRPTTTNTLNGIQQQQISGVATQVQQSSGAVSINGGVGGGIFIGAPPVGTTTSTGSTVDLDGDGIADINEGVGSITNFGSAPALSIGNSGTTAVTIGAFGATTLGDTNPNVPIDPNATPGLTPALAANNYGLIVRGAIAGEGVYDGVGATALQIGSGSTSAPVNLVGGVRVVGSISADSFLANATAIHIEAGGNVPEIRNEDFIESSISSSVASGTNLAGLDTPNAASTAILIDAGANVGSISNYGTLQASANGDAFTAAAVRDLSGKITNVLNEGVISAIVTPATAGLTLSPGSTVALDLQANTTGVALTQTTNPNPIAVNVSTTTSATGLVSSTAALSTVTSSVATTVTTTTAGVTTTTTTTTPVVPQIIGDVLLGSGANTVNIFGGTVTGALSLGTGTGGSLTIGQDVAATATSAAVEQTGFFEGPLTFSGTELAINVANGTLINTSATTVNLSSLNVGSKGVLYVAIDPLNSNAHTLYSVTPATTAVGSLTAGSGGTATLAPGAQLGIVLNSPLTVETSYTVVQAAHLTDNSGGALNAADIPYVLIGTETSNAAAGTISIDLNLKTTTQLGLNPGETSAFNAIYADLPNDPAIEAAVLGQYTKSAFLGVYDQLLPEYAGGVFQLTLAASDAVTRATSRVNDIQNPSGTRGAWAEEVAFGVNRDRSSQSAGYQGGGFGFVGGLETGGAGLGAFGVTGAFLTGDIKDPHSPGDNLSSFSEGEGGAYWQAQLGGLRGDARVAGGYVLDGQRRELLLRDANGNTTLDRASKSNESGYTATGHFGLGYQTGVFRGFYFRPQVHGDYFYLNQGSYNERDGASPSGPDGFDLNVANRNGNETSGTASLVTGYTFGQGFQWRPELELGYRDVFTGTAGATTARFASGAQTFTLSPDDIKGGGGVARLGVKADTDFYELNFEAGAEERTHFTEGDARISVRVLF